MSQIKDLSLRIDTFKRMTNLRFLKFYSSNGSCKIYLHEGIELFSDKLRYFHWHGFPLQSIPSAFCAEKLVELHMPNGHVTMLWDGLQVETTNFYFSFYYQLQFNDYLWMSLFIITGCCKFEENRSYWMPSVDGAP